MTVGRVANCPGLTGNRSPPATGAFTFQQRSLTMTSSSIVPKGHHTVTTCVSVKGALNVLDFVTQVLGAKIVKKNVNDDGALMHAEVKIGDTRIMLGEVSQGSPMPAMFYVYVADCDAIYKKAIKSGAESIRPPADQFYGDRSGAVRDKAGNQWFFATPKQRPSPAKSRSARRGGKEAI
jgi:PhnB protein